MAHEQSSFIDNGLVRGATNKLVLQMTVRVLRFIVNVIQSRRCGRTFEPVKAVVAVYVLGLVSKKIEQLRGEKRSFRSMRQLGRKVIFRNALTHVRPARTPSPQFQPPPNAFAKPLEADRVAKLRRLTPKVLEIYNNED